MRKCLLLFLLISGLIIFSAGFQKKALAKESPQGKASPSQVTEAPRLLKVKVGEKFTLSLTCNPTTGYRWKIAQAYDTRIVRLIDFEYQPPKQMMPGAGGKEIWTFKGLAKGKTKFSLKYLRTWEKDQPPAKIKNFEAEVY